jgi:PAS domain S-box-containing protein
MTKKKTQPDPADSDKGLPEPEAHSQAAQALRQRAEEVARQRTDQTADSSETLLQDEPLGLFHELRVHQIELEMQNEELRRSQLELGEARARYFELYDLAPVGYLVLNEKNLIREANLTAASLLGVGRSALLKKPLTSFILPEDQDIYYHYRMQLFETGTPQRCELRVLHQGGASFWARLDTTPAQDADGRPECRVVLSDINERQQAGEVLRNLSTRQEAILAAVPDILMEVDKRKVYTWANPAGYAFFGEDVIGKEAAFYFEGEQDIFTYVQPLFDGDENIISMESWQRRKDGEKRLLAWWCRVLKDLNGNVVGLLSSARDITEIRQAEEQIRTLNTELEERVEVRTRQLQDAQEKLLRQERLVALGQLAGSVGHELRNPLGVIANAIYYLKMVLPQTDEKVKEYLGIIEDETKNAEKIITDLLEFSRTKSIDRKAVSVPYLLQRVVDRYPTPEGIRVELDFPPDLPSVYVDPRHIEQVLGNLVVNAYQAMPEGGQLTVGSCQLSVINDQKRKDQELTTDHYVRITFQDTGTGIPPENIDKLFEPLFTTKARGIGLGLAVSQKLVEANDGRIEVQSEVGKGSTFSVYLPVPREVG